MKKACIAVVGLLQLLFTPAPANILDVGKKPEKIYAVMITGKDDFHKTLAERSIQSFLQQTYPNKHLIIVNDGTYSLGHLNQDLITEIKLDKKHVLGALRNIGIKPIPENGIYLQWDDDDWHHQDLMEKQYQYMQTHAADGCILHSQIVYFFKTNAAWATSQKAGIEGTVMCRKKEGIVYPEDAKGEDTIFLKNYMKKYKIITWNNPTFYYLRFVHGHNTWDDKHFALYFKIKNLKENQWAIPQAAIDYLSTVVPLYAYSK